jgi:hypothetical protein
VPYPKDKQFAEKDNGNSLLPRDFNDQCLHYMTACSGLRMETFTARFGTKWDTIWELIEQRMTRDLDEALQEDSSVLEEMKADLVSLFVAEALHKQGYYNDAQLKSVYAGGMSMLSGTRTFME